VGRGLVAAGGRPKMFRLTGEGWQLAQQVGQPIASPIVSPWTQLTSTCKRLRHPPRLNDSQSERAGSWRMET
jgi:hypothetical protein